MSSPAPLAELLAALAARGIELWCEGDRLRFQAPKGTLHATERALLSAQRRDVMAVLRAAGAARRDELPLSFPQFAMWFQHQQSPSSGVCTVGSSLTATGPLDAAALRHAVQALADRHPVLRTTYHVCDGVVIQRVAGSTPATLEVQPYRVHDARGGDTLSARIAGCIARPFDLERGPIFRVCAFTDGGGEHTVLVTSHHIAVDGRSMQIMASELVNLYGEAADNRPPGLARPPATYADFVHWQATEIDGACGDRQWAYWSRVLAAPRERTQLPTHVVRPAVPRFVGAAVSTALSAALMSRVQALAAQLRTTPFVVLLGAFQILLARLCGVRDVVTGMPVLGRPKSEYLAVVGNFMNVLPVRSRLEETASVAEFLARLRMTVVESLDAQDYPLLRMVQQLHLSGEETGQALFNTSFTVVAPDGVGTLPRHAVGGTIFVAETWALQTGLVDLGLDIFPADGGMACALKYSLDALTASSAADFARQYPEMLEAITNAPDQALSALLSAPVNAAPDDSPAAALLGRLTARDITLTLDGDRLRVNAPKGALDPADRDAIAAHKTAIIARLRAAAAGAATDGDPAAGDPVVAHDRSLCLHQLLERSAREHPERIAVSSAGGELPYGVLDARANQLAQYLVRAGVCRGGTVAVCLERTANIPMALAAVLKAGGAYVPLDPVHPRERLRGILRDAGAGFLITQEGFEDIAEGTAAQTLRLDTDSGAIDACPGSSPGVLVRPGDLAYVIYTSGSTGKPKGVEVEHRNVVAFLDAMRRQPGFHADDVMLAVTTLAFDIAGLEIWLPLSVGARMVMAGRADALDGARLGALLDTSAVSIMQATPATWRLLLESGWAGRPGLRALCGGETLPRSLAARLVGRVEALWNMYGPTETTIWSTTGRVSAAAVSNEPAAVPIGRPIANTIVRIEDRNGAVVPAGVVGELLIGGEGVARGYRDQPDLTAGAFVMRSNAGVACRMYRTGDLARFLGDGQIEFLGRRDHQIKLRGHRIEPGEIEALLAGLAGVTGSLVMAQAASDDERLVAYLTLAAGVSLDPGALRTALRARLPDYMVPGQFVVLPAFPLTPNGKVDRKALPLPPAMGAESAPGTPQIPAVPMTPAQQRVAALWKQVLHTGRVGLNDNFFDIGGHSLLLVKIHAGLKREFGRELPFVELFQHTTVAQQARVLESISDA